MKSRGMYHGLGTIDKVAEKFFDDVFGKEFNRYTNTERAFYAPETMIKGCNEDKPMDLTTTGEFGEKVVICLLEIKFYSR
jgi:hypothetical protein